MIDSSSYEDEINILLDKLIKTISTFNTLSREQAENAILDTTSKIKNGESLLSKLEEELENNSSKYTQEELIEERKKIKNYKTEFNDIVNKFKTIQDNYINKKTKNALIDDEPQIKNIDLLSNEERKNNFEGKSKEKFTSNNIEEKKNEHNVFENNIGNISGVNNEQNITDDTFDHFNNSRFKRRKKCLMIGLVITFILIVTFVIVIGIESGKK
jgi:hypothetical protein